MKKYFILWTLLFLVLGGMNFGSDEMTTALKAGAAEESFRSEEAGRSRLFSAEFLDVPDSYYGKPIFTGADLKARNVKNGVFSLPFQTDRQAERFYFDEKVDLDLSGSPMYYLVLTFDKENEIQAPSLYFHSGNGWFSMSGKPVKKLDGKTVRCEYNSAEAHTEGTPAGLDQVDIIRIGCWRSSNVDFKFEVKGFYHGRPSTVGVLQARTDKESNTFSGLMGKQLQQAGISGARIMQDQLTSKLLDQYKAIVIPIGGGLTEKSVDLLCDYLDKGGFLMMFYGAQPRLMKKMGFGAGEYVRCSQKTVELAKIVFTPDFVRRYSPQMPKEMDQASYNIIWAEPLKETDDAFLKQRGNVPRIAGWWYDNKGQKTNYPAVLRSGRGIYFSHVLLNDDAPRKEKFLLALLNRFDPEGIRIMFCEKWRALFDIGAVPVSNINEYYTRQGQKILDLLAAKGWQENEIVRLLDSLDQKNQKSESGSPNDVRFAALLDTFAEIRTILVKDYLKKMDLVKTETRFWWEHSGTGPYPGDWDRTMKELAQNGYNGVISNMAWGGTAYYNSDLLPRHEKTIQYGDQIAQFAAAGKKYGVETHVWKVNFNCSNAPKSFIDQMKKENRLQKDRQGNGGDKNWLCPSHPKNQDLEVAVMLEIAQKYEIDGIHFDYIRYPDQSHCFCDGCRDRFSAYYFEKTGKKLDFKDQEQKKDNAKDNTGKIGFDWGKIVLNDPQISPLFIQWRCDQITSIVRRTREAVDKMTRNVLISAAVFSGYPGTRKSVGQDWGEWCRKGYLDFVCPMNYTDQPSYFAGLVDRQLEAVKGSCPIYPGIGVTVPVLLSPDKTAEQIEITRQKKTGGYCMFDLSKRTIKSTVPVSGGTPLGEKAVPSHRVSGK